MGGTHQPSVALMNWMASSTPTSGQFCSPISMMMATQMIRGMGLNGSHRPSCRGREKDTGEQGSVGACRVRRQTAAAAVHRRAHHVEVDEPFWGGLLLQLVEAVCEAQGFGLCRCRWTAGQATNSQPDRPNRGRGQPGPPCPFPVVMVPMKAWDREMAVQRPQQPQTAQPAWRALR